MLRWLYRARFLWLKGRRNFLPFPKTLQQLLMPAHWYARNEILKLHNSARSGTGIPAWSLLVSRRPIQNNNQCCLLACTNINWDATLQVFHGRFCNPAAIAVDRIWSRDDI